MCVEISFCTEIEGDKTLIKSEALGKTAARLIIIK